MTSSQLGLELKEQALDRLSEGNAEVLAAIRDRLRHYCCSTGQPVSTDDAWRLAFDLIPQLTSSNALGALFRSHRWRAVGRKVSERPEAHGNELTTYLHRDAE